MFESQLFHTFLCKIWTFFDSNVDSFSRILLTNFKTDSKVKVTCSNPNSFILFLCRFFKCESVTINFRANPFLNLLFFAPGKFFILFFRRAAHFRIDLLSLFKLFGEKCLFGDPQNKKNKKKKKEKCGFQYSYKR